MGGTLWNRKTKIIPILTDLFINGILLSVINLTDKQIILEPFIFFIANERGYKRSSISCLQMGYTILIRTRKIMLEVA